MSIRTEDRKYLLAALSVAALVVMLTAALQWGMGRGPDEMVWDQQLAYVVGFPLLAFLFVARDGLNRAMWAALAVLAIALFGWSAMTAGIHTAFATGSVPTIAVCDMNGQPLGVSPELLGSDPMLQQCLPATSDVVGVPLPFANLIASLVISGLIVAALLQRVGYSALER